MKKKLFLLFFIASCLFPGSVLKNCYGQCISYDVHACIDYLDDLHFQGTQLWWTHPGGGSTPGTHSSCSGDVLSVNGTPWGAWNTPFTVSGNTTCMDMTAVITQNSNAAYSTQTASSSNGWETIYRFDDSGPSAAHPYKIVFTFCPATPTSTFTASSPACSGNDVTITYTGTGSTSAVYNWNFDGATVISGSGQGPYVVNWAAPATYNVTLDVTDCSSTSPLTTVPVVVVLSPTSFFTASTPVCENDNATITFIGSASPSDIYTWNFDGGNVVSGSGQGPYSINWPAAGIKNVTLSVDASGCISALTTIPVTVIQPPTSAFIASAPVCKGDIATITYTGTASPSANYFWSFDGGSVVSGSGQGPYTVSWSTAGTYNCTLTVTENDCPSTITTVQQIVDPPPHANFGFADVCLNQVMGLTDLSSFAGGTITAWEWDFGDSSPLNNTQNPGYTYTNAGTYIVSLIVSNNNGCKDTVTKSVIVHALPDADFSSSNVCDGSFLQFTSLSTISNPGIIQVSSWDFGDGSSGNNPNASHLYPAAGSYVVQLLNVSNFGCSDSVSKTSIINPNPVVSFSANDTIGCQPLCISFQNSSTVLTGANVQWIWNIDDGTPLTDSQSVDHCYTNDSVNTLKFFNVTLTVTSDSGCVSTLTKNNYITVYPDPIANFTAQPETATIIDPVISIKDLSVGASHWNWNFGDGSAPFITNLGTTPPPHAYGDTGTYVITLITSTQYNCSDTTYQQIIIEPDFVFYVPNAFTPDGDGVNDIFSGKGIFIKEFKMNIFDRWGNMIFVSEDINIPWDGKANKGKEVALTDVYIYSITVTDFKDLKHNYKGIVTLLK